MPVGLNYGQVDETTFVVESHWNEAVYPLR
jgi:hypothetical protein